jgi:hypothetical protein
MDNFRLGVIRVDLACPQHVRLGGNLGDAGCCPVLPVEGRGLDVIPAPKPEPDWQVSIERTSKIFRWKS